MDGKTDGWTDRQMDKRMDRRTDGWTDGQVDGRMDGWMDRRREFLPILQDFFLYGSCCPASQRKIKSYKKRQGKGIADHLMPLGDWFHFCPNVPPSIYPSSACLSLLEVKPGFRASQPVLIASQPDLKASQPGRRARQTGLNASCVSMLMSRSGRP